LKHESVIDNVAEKAKQGIDVNFFLVILSPRAKIESIRDCLSPHRALQNVSVICIVAAVHGLGDKLE
jgi:hypothetical protein